MEQKRKIYCVYYTHKPGGFCKRLYRLLNALSAQGHAVTYFTLDRPPASLSSAVQVKLIPFLTTRRNGLLFWSLFTVWCPVYLLAQLLFRAPDRICVFGAYYAGMFRLGRLFVRRPLVLFLRSLVFRIDEINDKPQSLRSISNIVDYAGIRSASRVVCMTKAMRDEIEAFFGLKLQDAPLLPNDIPESRKNREKAEEASLDVFEALHSELAQERMILLTSGVIDRRKNIDYLLEVFSLLKIRGLGDNILLLVAGDGPLLAQYRAEASARELSNVRFLGWCDTLEPLYPFVDLVVHPALHEGIPNSVLEALAAGLPILCSDTEEMREVFSDPELLFDPRNPEALATRLGQVLDSPEKALSFLSKKSQEASKSLQFDWDSRAVSLVLAPFE